MERVAAPARLGSLRGSQLARVYDEAVRDAQQGRTERLFTLIMTNVEAARLLLENPSHWTITARMGVGPAAFQHMLDDHSNREMSFESMRVAGTTPRWMAAQHAALHHPELGQEMAAKGPELLNLKSMNVSVADLLWHTVHEVREQLGRSRRGAEAESPVGLLGNGRRRDQV
jgi:hypothetical protein